MLPVGAAEDGINTGRPTASLNVGTRDSPATGVVGMAVWKACNTEGWVESQPMSRLGENACGGGPRPAVPAAAGGSQRADGGLLGMSKLMEKHADAVPGMKRLNSIWRACRSLAVRGTNSHQSAERVGNQ